MEIYVLAAALGAAVTSASAVWAFLKERYNKRDVELTIDSDKKNILATDQLTKEQVHALIEVLEQVQAREIKVTRTPPETPDETQAGSSPAEGVGSSGDPEDIASRPFPVDPPVDPEDRPIEDSSGRSENRPRQAQGSDEPLEPGQQ
jgi:hypothetical protein